MAKKKFKAVAYYRMSSDDQKTSIGTQRRRVHAYARQHGIEIIYEYVDEGKSGSKDQDKRIAFQQMLLDSAKGAFIVILCLNTSRFARLDSIDGAYAKGVLRKNGVHLETVDEGKIDWNTFEGRIRDMILSEGDHKRALDISNNTVNGRIDKLNSGFWPNGAIPYGYDRLYVSENGDEHFVRRSDRFRKPRNWNLKLVENEEEAQIVRWLFNEFYERDTSLRQLAKDLTIRGAPSPSGGNGWTKDTVKDRLLNRAYIGVGHIGMGRRRAKTAFNRIGPIQKDGCCPVIVDKDVFDAVQIKLNEKKESGRKPQKNRSSALSGILLCGHCGYRMAKKSHKGRVFFTCESATRRPQCGCHQWRVHEDEMMPFVTQILVDEVDIELLKSIQSQPSSRAEENGDVVLLEKRRDELERKISKGNERYLSAPDELLAGLEKTLTSWKKELETVQRTIRVAEATKTEDGVSSFARWWHRVKDALVAVADIEWSDPKSEKFPILLCKPDRKAIQKHMGAKSGKCRVKWDWNGNESQAPNVIIDGEDGNFIEIDEDGQAWEWKEMVGPTRPAIFAEPDVLRDLMHRLKVRVKLRWKKHGTRNFVLDGGQIQAEINGNVLAGRTGMPSQNVLTIKIEHSFKGAPRKLA